MNRSQKDPSQVIKQLEARCKAYVAENTRLETKVKQLAAEVSRMRLENSQHTGIKRQVKELYSSLDQAIQHTLHVRGYNQAGANRVSIAPDVLESGSKAQLQRAAMTYDAQAYFVYNRHASKMKLRYKIASKAYRTSRDVALKSARGVYRFVKKARR